MKPRFQFRGIFIVSVVVEMQHYCPDLTELPNVGTNVDQANRSIGDEATYDCASACMAANGGRTKCVAGNASFGVWTDPPSCTGTARDEIYVSLDVV